jgi:hypothetical protein
MASSGLPPCSRFFRSKSRLGISSIILWSFLIYEMRQLKILKIFCLMTVNSMEDRKDIQGPDPSHKKQLWIQPQLFFPGPMRFVYSFSFKLCSAAYTVDTACEARASTECTNNKRCPHGLLHYWSDQLLCWVTGQIIILFYNMHSWKGIRSSYSATNQFFKLTGVDVVQSDL